MKAQKRNILSQIFGAFRKDQAKTYTQFNELGTFKSYFGAFGNNIYASDDVRTCVRTLSEHTSKANPRCNNKKIERLLSIRPNQYMNGKDMLAKLRNFLEIKNTSFLFIQRKGNEVIGFYPVPYAEFEPLEYMGDIYIQFYFNGTETQSYVLPWEDLAVLRKDYVFSDFAGEGNEPLLPTLDVIKTLDTGTANAIKSTANLRGILKSTKGMLDPNKVKESKDRFVQDYMNINNEGGIAALDGTMEFQEINLKPTIANADDKKTYTEKVYKYFGVSENIIMSKYTESEYDAFYESRIEPFLVALSLELTGKIFTDREISHGNLVYYESNRLQFASAKTKISMVALVDRGLMTPNEYRALFNLAPYEGGDEFVLRLDTAKTGDSTDPQEGEKPNEEGE